MLVGQRVSGRGKAGGHSPLDRVVVTWTLMQEELNILQLVLVNLNIIISGAGGRRGQNKQVKSYLELLYIKGTPVYMQNSHVDEILNK